MALTNFDFALTAGSALPSGISVVQGSVDFNGSGLVATSSDTIIQFDNLTQPNFRVDIVLSGDRTDFTGIQFRRVSNTTYWRMNLKNVYTRAVLQRLVDDAIVPNAGYANSLADANRGGESTTYRLVTTGDEQQIFVGGEREAGKKGILTDESDSNLPLRIVMGSDAELRSLSFAGFNANALPEIDTPKQFKGFTRSTTKLGQFLQNPSGFVGPMYWFAPLPTAGIPDWNLSDPNNTTKYPLIAYASPDHAESFDDTAGIYAWVFQPELSSFTDPDAILSDPACWVEWNLVSNRPEFAHVTQKENPIFQNLGRQPETPCPVIHEGVVYLNYHEFGVNVESLDLEEAQASKYTLSTNGIDFAGDALADFTEGTPHNFTYNPKKRAGNGHTGYDYTGLNTIEEIPYKFIGRALKGGGDLSQGSSSQIIVGDSPDDMNFYKEFSASLGFLDDYNLTGREGYNTSLWKIFDAKKEGGYYRVIANNASFTFGPQVAPAYVTEVLVDSNLNMVSAPSFFLSSSVGEFDELACREYVEVEWSGRTYGFYNTVDANGNTSWGAVRVRDVPHTWDIVQPLSSKATPVEIISDGLSPATGVTYSETATAYQAQETLGDVRNGTYTNYTSLKLPLNGDVSTALVGSPITLSDHDYIDFDFDLIGKESDGPIELYTGFADDLTAPTNETSYYWPSGIPADDSQPMLIHLVGTVQDSDQETLNRFGNTDVWESNQYNNEDKASSKHAIGFRIVPSLDQLIVKYDLGFREVIDITGLDYTVPLNAFIKARLTTPQSEDAAVSFSNLRITTSSANAVAVPDAPTVTVDVTEDTVTLTTNTVSGADGYKYYLDDQSNETGVFTGLNSSTEYTVWARAFNALGDSETSDIQTTTTSGAVNNPPIADAGTGRTGVAAGSRVDFDFTGSEDTDGTIVSYNVTQTAGTVIVVVGGTSTPTPYFIAPTEGAGQTLEFELTVTDDKNSTSTTSVVSFDILAENVDAPPVAAITGNASGLVTAEQVLSGSTSYDPEGNTLTYEWDLAVPSGSTATLDNTDTNNTSYTPDVAGEYVVSLTVRDGALSSTSTLVVAINENPNTAPTPNAGPDQQNIISGGTLTLNGSNTLDPSNIIVNIQWNQTAGTNAIINDPGELISSVTLPTVTANETMTFELTITDSSGNTYTDSVSFSVLAIAASSLRIDSYTIKFKDNKQKVIKGFDNEVFIDFTFANDFTLSEFTVIEVKIGDETYSTIDDPTQVYILENRLVLNIGENTTLEVNKYKPLIIGKNAYYNSGHVFTSPVNPVLGGELDVIELS